MWVRDVGIFVVTDYKHIAELAHHPTTLYTLVSNLGYEWTADVLVQSHHERPDSAHSVYKIRPVSRLYPFLHLCGPDSSQIEGQSKLPDIARREVNQNLEIASHSYLISYTRIQLLVFLYNYYL
jgi:hypothetical protein